MPVEGGALQIRLRRRCRRQLESGCAFGILSRGVANDAINGDGFVRGLSG
jgi:hypothetical protein